MIRKNQFTNDIRSPFKVFAELVASAFLAIFLSPFPVDRSFGRGYRFDRSTFWVNELSNRRWHKRAPNALADKDSLIGESTPTHAIPNLRWSVAISLVLLFLWLGPVLGLYVGLGPQNIFFQLAIFFCKMTMVTFGGAYAVLSYVAQGAV